MQRVLRGAAGGQEEMMKKAKRKRKAQNEWIEPNVQMLDYYAKVKPIAASLKRMENWTEEDYDRAGEGKKR